MGLSDGEIIKVTSKGQITIPAKIRKALSLDRDSYIYVTRAERLLVMRKVDDLSLDEISAVLGVVARRDREERAEYGLRDVPKFEGKYAEAEIGRVVGEREKRGVIPFVWEEGRWKVGAAYRDGRSWDGEDF